MEKTVKDKKFVMKKNIVLRVLYTACFLALCIIDQILGSQTGRVQFVASNLTGVVIGIIILSGYKIKDFLKPVYAMWTGLMCIFVPVVLIYGEAYPYKGKLITALINIVLYGFIVIRVVEKQIIDKQYSKVRWGIFVGWICMIGLMIASRYEGLWPLWFGAMFGSFYLTDYSKEQRELLLKSAVDGIIVGFFIIQGMALLFRPYDTWPRYPGMFLNANMNALFYLTSYCAFLCKYIILKKEKGHIVFRLLFIFLVGSMYGFTVLTGAKTSLLTMAIVTIIFLIVVIMLCKKKILSFFRYGISIAVIAIVCIPLTYYAVRYIPTLHLHPIYFEGEWAEWRLQPGEPRNSEKYITFNRMLDENLGRIFWFVESDEEGVLSGVLPTLHAYAFNADIEYKFTDEQIVEMNPFELRFEIYKYFFSKLNLTGHMTDEEWAPLSYGFVIPHAHNWLLQLSFWFGIPVGIFLIIMCILYVIRFVKLLLKGDEIEACILGCFATAFIVFGTFEIDWRVGQLPFTLFFMLFYVVVRQSKTKTEETNRETESE